MLENQNITEPVIIIGNCLGAVLGLEMISRKLIVAKKIFIIEKNEEKVKIIRNDKMLYIHGDATAELTIENSHIKYASGVVVVL